MDLIKFKKLETKVKKTEFGKDYKSLNTILRVLSVFGNIVSIFLASFFISEILKVVSDDVTIRWIISIMALSGIELVKRDVFNKFSKNFIRVGTIFKKGIFPMLIFTMILISLSFYSSLSGAQKFTSKSDEIETVMIEKVSTFKDSTNTYYQNKIDILEAQNTDLFDQNKSLNDEASELPSNWIRTKEKIRNNISINNTQIEKNDSKIKDIKLERDSIIDEYEKDEGDASDKEKGKNNSDSLIFIMISTLIEFLILIGIYFNNIYNFRSYRDTRNKLLNDSNFKTYYDYSEILNVMFLNKEEKDQIPSIDFMKDLLVMKKVYLSLKQIEDAIKLFTALKIIETNDIHTYLVKDKEESYKEIKKHFNIT